jgi:hypothetical protein
MQIYLSAMMFFADSMPAACIALPRSGSSGQTSKFVQL